MTNNPTQPTAEQMAEAMVEADRLRREAPDLILGLSTTERALVHSVDYCAELVEAYQKYIKLLGAEIRELEGLALVHGWESTRVKQGKECRDKIGKLLAKWPEKT